MTEEQRAVVRRIYEAINRRDLDRLRLTAGDGPDFAWTSSADEPDTGERRGTRAATAHLGELFKLFDELHTAIEEEIDLGPDQAIFVVRHEVRGATSGARTERSEAHLWTFDGRRVTSLREFPSVEQAREAAREGGAGA